MPRCALAGQHRQGEQHGYHHLRCWRAVRRRGAPCLATIARVSSTDPTTASASVWCALAGHHRQEEQHGARGVGVDVYSYLGWH